MSINGYNDLTHKELLKLNKSDLQVKAKKLLDDNNELQEKLLTNQNDSISTNNAASMMEILTTMKQEISEISTTMKALLEENSQLKATIVISKNVTDLLKKQIIALEIQSNKTDQYSRRECLEISGIPGSIADDNLEELTLEIFKSIDVDIPTENVHACHRIGKKGNAIIKLVNRKDVHQILVNKKKLKDTNKCDLGLEVNTKIYINESLCPYYKGLWTKAKKLLNKDRIDSFWTHNGSIKIKMLDDNKAIYVFHDNFFTENFPDFNFTHVSY